MYENTGEELDEVTFILTIGEKHLKNDISR